MTETLEAIITDIQKHYTALISDLYTTLIESQL